MTAIGQDTLKTRRTLTVRGQELRLLLAARGREDAGRHLPPAGQPEDPAGERAALRGRQSYTVDDAKAIAGWLDAAHSDKEVPFKPARILMQDFTGVPAVVDLAAMRDGITRLGGNPQKVNPLVPVDLVIDHSVQVDVFARPDALQKNVDIEFERNGERYQLPALGPGRVRQFPRRAAGHRHLPPGEPGIPRPVRVDLDATPARPSPIPTRCTAPTATPRW